MYIYIRQQVEYNASPAQVHILILWVTSRIEGCLFQAGSGGIVLESGGTQSSYFTP